jgi:hypothetical protein
MVNEAWHTGGREGVTMGSQSGEWEAEREARWEEQTTKQAVPVRETITYRGQEKEKSAAVFFVLVVVVA